MRPRVPVVIVSGFLGSGKTTLVRALLTGAQARGERAAVVSNEFGELGIDEALLGGGREEFVELAGGCVCCALSDELVETLERLREKVDPDVVFIETSGVALPFDTQLNLYRPPVNAWVGDEAVVVVVSADQGVPEAGDEEVRATWEQQVTGADLVLIHKVDLADPAAVEAAVQDLNPGVPMIRAVRGVVPYELLVPSGPRTRAVPGEHAEHDHAEHGHGEHGHGEHGHGPHPHDAFESFEVRLPDGLDEDAALTTLAAHHALRIKGFVRTSAGVRIVQGVGRRLELVDPGDMPVDDALLGRVVVIRACRHPRASAVLTARAG